ncbi:hypothetical protein [Nocardia goodfellowii]|uniref:Uncharacterized protein n=1 Tax=Nocardia goodfellowii TaxID=882446 RepID=A0ABS4QBF7_9NOCA|nr:hypothetical protein [Nocardia goodfellowii]MBP2188021.1 hypothetical protein [Nocardia goodfellowii]
MTPWLPLVSSLVVASVTLIGIRINNRTNRAAIAATDVREFRKWQRETVLRQCVEALETAHVAHDEFHNIWSRLSKPSMAELRGKTDEFYRKLSLSATTLEMLDAPAVSVICHDLRFQIGETQSASWFVLDHPDLEYDDLNLDDLERNVNLLDGLVDRLAAAAHDEFERLARADHPARATPIRARFLRGHRSND